MQTRKNRAARLLVKAVSVVARGAWQTLRAALGRRRRSDQEHFLASSVNHAEVERREREWNRWQSRDGSLLGSI
jgi:hypothetical protein